MGFRPDLLSSVFLLVVLGSSSIFGDDANMPKLEDSMSLDFLQKNLRPQQPRLGLTPEVEANLRARLESDPVVQSVYRTIQRDATKVLDEPLLTRTKIGKRLLSTSREMLRRMNVLCLVYRIEKSPEVLARINDELLAVCEFSDWNPSHFLDVAEMSLGVAIGLDWTTGDLPDSTIEIVQRALIDKALKANGKTRILRSSNNWNQVCNGGMIAAALAVADLAPELAATTIEQALEALPIALRHYGPDGAHPEGATYWGYATMYTACTSMILESALGTDFGMDEYPGLRESAMYRVVMTAPSQQYFNYGDCGDRRSRSGDLALAWFASKTGDSTYYEKERFLKAAENKESLGRFVGFGLLWLAQFEQHKTSAVPLVWSGRGINPVAVFQDVQGDYQDADLADPRRFYFACKGGSASVSHGNMDAGSFVLEFNGVRWAIDPGGQSYHEIERTGFDLWDKKQGGDRWKLLSKNNFGHNTLTINGQPHLVDGESALLDCNESPRPEASFDLTGQFSEAVTKVTRTFVRDSNASVVITDSILESSTTQSVTWQMLTLADVQLVGGGALLSQSGQKLRLENLSHPSISVSVVSLDPPPISLDTKMEGLKRLEIQVPGSSIAGREIQIKIRLSED